MQVDVIAMSFLATKRLWRIAPQVREQGKSIYEYLNEPSTFGSHSPVLLSRRRYGRRLFEHVRRRSGGDVIFMRGFNCIPFRPARGTQCERLSHGLFVIKYSMNLSTFVFDSSISEGKQLLLTAPSLLDGQLQIRQLHQQHRQQQTQQTEGYNYVKDFVPCSAEDMWKHAQVAAAAALFLSSVCFFVPERSVKRPGVCSCAGVPVKDVKKNLISSSVSQGGSSFHSKPANHLLRSLPSKDCNSTTNTPSNTSVIQTLVGRNSKESTLSFPRPPARCNEPNQSDSVGRKKLSETSVSEGGPKKHKVQQEQHQQISSDDHWTSIRGSIGKDRGEEHHESPLWRSEEKRPFEKKLEDALLFCGNSNEPLGKAVADRLSTKLGKVCVKRFADGEVNIQFLDSLRGKDVYIIQPTSWPVNEHLMELLLMVSTCRRASAKKITAVIPYYGYARQDRKLSSRVPISAADVARMIEAMGVDRVVAVDLHCGQIQGFFGPRVPVDNLEAQIIGLEYFQHKNLQKPVVVSPDAGGVYRARKFQEGLLARGYNDCGIAMLIKQRLRANEIERMDLVGAVDGSDVIIVDDMVDTAGTLCEAARELRNKGARRVFAFATHGLFSGPAITRIEASPLEEVVVTDSIKARPEVVTCPRITTLSISVLLADAIRRIHQKESLNDLFNVKSW